MYKLSRVRHFKKYPRLHKRKSLDMVSLWRVPRILIINSQIKVAQHKLTNQLNPIKTIFIYMNQTQIVMCLRISILNNICKVPIKNPLQK